MAVRGIWTPRGEVLCLSCHGRRTWHGKAVPAEDAWQRRNEAVLPEADDAETCCARCCLPIVVRADVAALHGVRTKLRAAGIRTAVMEQTGGMCAAVLVPAPDGARVQVYADEEDPANTFIIARAGRDDSEEAVVATVRGTAAAVSAVRQALA